MLDTLPKFYLRYRPDKEAARLDALSGLVQDSPINKNDALLRYIDLQLIGEDWIVEKKKDLLNQISIITPEKSPLEEEDLSHLWKDGLQADGEYRDIQEALIKNKWCCPPSVAAKISISECDIDDNGFVRWRDRFLIPTYEPLQTAIIHRAHDSPVTGHPGREGTLVILSRGFYWPIMSHMVRQIVLNCDICGLTHVWRDKKCGYFKPLPIPELFHQELSTDFKTDFPAKKYQPRF